MPNNTERPFGRDTLKIDAAFVPDDAEDELSRAEITAAVGSRPVKLPAVLVPEGEPPPGAPYVSVGEFEFRPDQDGVTGRLAAGSRVRWLAGAGTRGARRQNAEQGNAQSPAGRIMANQGTV
jgi:hypothetical protein